MMTLLVTHSGVYTFRNAGSRAVEQLLPDLRNIFLDPRPLDSYSSRTPLWRCRSQNRPRFTPSTGKRLRDPSMFRRADFRLW